MARLRMACFLANLTALVTAQSVWVVDASGAGNFTDLPPALAAAAHGDTIVVRPGDYTPGQTSRGVRILGDPGARLTTGTFTVSGLPAGREFRMTGLDVVSGYFIPGVHVLVSRCAGSVLLQDLSSNTGSTFTSIGTPSLTIERCVDVHVHDCSWQGEIGAEVTDSHVTFTGVTLRGMEAFPGIRASGSVIDCAYTSIRGGDGLNLSGSRAQPAAELDRSVLRMCSGALIPGCQWAFISCTPTEHVAATPGTIVVLDPGVDPSPRLRGNVGTLFVVPLGCLDATAPSQGTPLTASLSAPNGLPAVVAASVPAVGFPTPFGELNLDPASTVVLSLGLTPLNIPAPTLAPGFVSGEAVTLQALVAFPRGIELTNAVDVLVH